MWKARTIERRKTFAINAEIVFGNVIAIRKELYYNKYGTRTCLHHSFSALRCRQFPFNGRND